MNLKQRYLYDLLHGPMGEYSLKLCFCLFNKKTCAMLLSFFYILCTEAHAYGLYKIQM